VFSSRLSTKSLAHLCRSLGTMLDSGIDVQRAFQLAAGKTSDPRSRSALARISLGISQGEDITEAMQEQGHTFPDLVIDMVSVAEQSGALPEILEGLADHYDNLLKLRKSFIAAIAWPVIELLMAIFIIAAAIWIIGMISGSGDSAGADSDLNFDMLGFGLSGGSGALLWLACTLGPLIGMVVGYKIISSTLSGKRFVDPILMRIPVVGNCMRAFAIARFSWAFYLTQQTGMPMKQSLIASLRATANGAFIARTRIIVDRIQSGDHLTEALAAAEIFPEDFLHMVDIGETSGTVPETLHRLSPKFEEQARRTLKALSVAGGVMVFCVVALLIGYIVISAVANYAGMIEDLSKPM
jgi:type IV pilus assembly protein PilC